jgi:arylamine N-acetyltransferase
VKERTGDPWMPADRYGRGLPAFTVNLLVSDVPRAVGFQMEVLAATVHYPDPDFAAVAVGGVELMPLADHTYDKHPWYAPLTRGASVIQPPDGYLWAVGVPTSPKPGS